MGIVGVPMVRRDPIELRAEILLHMPHKVAGEGSEVGHLRRILWRDDEAEMVSVAITALGKHLDAGVIGLGAEHAGLFPVTGHALALQVGKVCGERHATRRVTNDAGLDDRDARATGQQAVGLDVGDPAPAEARSVARADLTGAGDASTSFLRRRQGLGDERPHGLIAVGAYSPRSDAKLALIGHGVVLQRGKEDADTKPWGFDAHCAE